MTAQTIESHVGELALRRFRAGEALPDVEAHATTCADCRTRMKAALVGNSRHRAQLASFTFLHHNVTPPKTEQWSRTQAEYISGPPFRLHVPHP